MKSVAVIGASNDRGRFGNKAVRAYRSKGFRVYAVNPNEAEVEGEKAYSSVSSLPERPNLVSVYVRPLVLLRLLPEIAERGCDELWLNPGTVSAEVLEEAGRLGLTVVQACSLIALNAGPA